MKEYEVTWNCTFTTRLTLEPGQSLSDAIYDIEIPEDGKTRYQFDTFEVTEVFLEGNYIPESVRKSILGDALMDATYTSVFSNGIVCTSKCKYDPNSMRVFDVEVADNADDAENADARTDEYVTLPDGKVLREDKVKFDY